MNWGTKMSFIRVFLLKDTKLVGMAGEIVKVKSGYATNFLIPHKLGIEVNKENEHAFAKRQKVIEQRKDVIATETSMLAEKIKSISITIKEKAHGETDAEGRKKLYGAISANEIIDALSTKGIKVSKSQIEFGKSIRTTGSFEVTVKLSARLQPKMIVKVVAESEH
jgi:large subunit ribosomal protein L9